MVGIKPKGPRGLELRGRLLGRWSWLACLFLGGVSQKWAIQILWGQIANLNWQCHLVSRESMFCSMVFGVVCKFIRSPRVKIYGLQPCQKGQKVERQISKKMWETTFIFGGYHVPFPQGKTTWHLFRKFGKLRFPHVFLLLSYQAWLGLTCSTHMFHFFNHATNNICVFGTLCLVATYYAPIIFLNMLPHWSQRCSLRQTPLPQCHRSRWQTR